MAEQPTVSAAELRTLKNSAMTQKEINNLVKQKTVYTDENLVKLQNQNSLLKEQGLTAESLNEIYKRINSEQIKNIESKKKQKAESLILYQLELKRAGLNANQIKAAVKFKDTMETTKKNMLDILNNSKLLSNLENIPIFGEALSMGKKGTTSIVNMMDKMKEFGLGGIKVFSALRKASFGVSTPLKNGLIDFMNLSKQGMNTFSKMGKAKDLSSMFNIGKADIGKFGSLGMKMFSNLGKSGMGMINLLRAGFSSLGITMSSVLSGGMFLAVFAAITAGVYALQTAFKFNIGNIAGVWGSMMAKLKAMWSIFELKVAKGLGNFSEVFNAIFTTVADVVISTSELFFELAGAFGDAFTMFSDKDAMTGGFKGLGDIIKGVMKILMPNLKILMYVLGAVSSIVLGIITGISEIFGGLFKLIDSASVALENMLPSWAKKLLGVGSKPTSSITDAGQSGSVNNTKQNNSVNITVNGNMDKETANMVLQKQNTMLPNLAKMGSLNPI